MREEDLERLEQVERELVPHAVDMGGVFPQAVLDEEDAEVLAGAILVVLQDREAHSTRGDQPLLLYPRGCGSGVLLMTPSVALPLLDREREDPQVIEEYEPVALCGHLAAELTSGMGDDRMGWVLKLPDRAVYLDADEVAKVLKVDHDRVVCGCLGGNALRLP